VQHLEDIALTGVTERDVDLLLVEEVISSPGFVSWLLGQIGLDPSGTLSDIKHSVNTTNGESDIELDIRYGANLVKVLLEDKIDAPLQSCQAERYTDRAATYVKGKAYSMAVTLLVAPSDYAGGQDNLAGFDKRISYESVIEWFSNNEELGNRRLYKRSLLTSAIERGGSPWQLVPNEKTTAFWRDYWTIAERFANDLRMPKPTKKPATSSFIFFKPPGLALNVKLIHKVPYGKVDLQFAAMADHLDKLENDYGTKMDPDMTIVKASRSGAIRINVPELNLQSRPSESDVRYGVDAALRLLKLYRDGQKRKEQPNKSLQLTP